MTSLVKQHLDVLFFCYIFSILVHGDESRVMILREMRRHNKKAETTLRTRGEGEGGCGGGRDVFYRPSFLLCLFGGEEKNDGFNVNWKLDGDAM